VLENLDVSSAIAFVATSMTFAVGWPQLRRLRRTGDVAGVSLSMTTLSLASESGWLIYLSGSQLWSAVPEAVLTMGVGAALSVALRRGGSQWRRPVAAAIVWGAVLAGALAVGGLAAIGAMLSVAYALQLAPAVWTSWRAPCPSGVAPGAWMLRLAQSTLWGIYGRIEHDRPLATLGMIGAVASAAVLVRVAVTRPLGIRSESAVA
jgi:hypothetical protein